MPINDFPLLEGRGETGMRLTNKPIPSQFEVAELKFRQAFQYYKSTIEQALAEQAKIFEEKIVALQQEVADINMAWSHSKFQVAKDLLNLQDQITLLSKAVGDLTEVVQAERVYARLWWWQKLARWFRGQ